MTKIGKKGILIIFFLSLLIRIVFLSLVGQDFKNLISPDSKMYQELGQGIVETGEYKHKVLRDGNVTYYPETERVPVYPVYMALFYYVFGVNDWWAILGQCVLDSITCVFIGLIAAMINRKLFYLAGTLSAVNLLLLSHATVILTDSLFLFFFTLNLLFSAQYLTEQNGRTVILSGLFLGLAVLTRPLALYFIPVSTVIIGVGMWKKTKSPNLLIKHLSLWLVAVFVFLMPYLSCNYIKFGHFELTSQKGTTALFWYASLTLESSRGISYDDAKMRMKMRLASFLEERVMQKLPESAFEKSKILTKVAKEAFFEMSIWEIGKAWIRGMFINLFTPGLASNSILIQMDRPRFYKTEGSNIIEKTWKFMTKKENLLYSSLMVPALVWTMLCRILQVYGLIWLIKTKRADLFFPSLYMGVAFLYILVVTGPLVSASRYRLPVEPILIVLLAVGLHNILGKIFLTYKNL